VPGTVDAASGEVPRPLGLVGTDEFPARRLESGSVTSSTLNSRYTTMCHASELKYDMFDFITSRTDTNPHTSEITNPLDTNQNI